MLNKSVLITGSTNGLGRELALGFASKGYDVIIHGRNSLRLDELSCKVKENNVKCLNLCGDLNLDDTLTNLTRIADESNIGILVNNAGVYLNKPFSEVTQEELEESFRINFYVPFLLTKSILPTLERNGSGLIVNINSLAGKAGSPNETVYSASKHALKGFSESLRYEVIKNGIRLLDVYLGAMATQMTLGRKDQLVCINPKEAAEIITSLCRDYESLNINEIVIGRIKY